MNTTLREKPKPNETTPGPLAQRRRMELRLIQWLACLDEVVAWYLGAELGGISIKKRGDHYVLRLQVRKNKLAKVVVFTGRRPYDCLLALASGIKYGQIRYYDDKYPPIYGG